MENRIKSGLALSLCMLLAGCANQEVKPGTILCPLVGGLTGAGIVAAATDSDDPEAYVAGAALGGAVGYFFCREKPQPVAAAPAPAPAPKPVAPPPPPPPPPAPEIGTKVESLEGTNFDFDKSTLRPEAVTKLEHAVQVLADYPTVKLSIEGHTDSVGSDSYNQGLSERRAHAVMDYLTSHGVDASRLTATGYGEGKPTASNDTEEGRAQNRRVDLVVSDN